MLRLTNGSCKTERFTGQHAQKLLECDTVRTFTECGWFVITGMTDGEYVVKAHTKTKDKFKRKMNQVDPGRYPECSPFSVGRTGRVPRTVN